MEGVYVLGGFQTDFAEPWSRRRQGLLDILGAAVHPALEDARLAGEAIDSVHVGNFVSPLFTGQAHLGGLVASLDPGLEGKAATTHEAACASGSVAILAAMNEILAGNAACSLVVGVEQMRNVPGEVAAKNLSAAAWVGHEGASATYLWPHMFSRLADEYDERFGIDRRHLARIGEINLSNAKRNPNAQTRAWALTDASFSTDDTANPVIEGRIRKHDCSQVTDGACAVVLASRRFAEEHKARTGRSPIGRIAGFGHRTSTISYDAKVEASRSSPYVFPQVRNTILDAFRRASVADVSGIDAIETHDCFTPTEYMAIDHFGITAPGESWKAIENDDIALSGRIPINPSGGLIGVGHPVGATGVRMVLDASKQVSGLAGDYQVENAERVATLNIGGSATTIVSFVVDRPNAGS